MRFSIITNLTLIVVFTFANLLRAEDLSLPVITKPSVLDEGTQRTLSVAQISELTPWAKDSKMALVDLLDNISSLGASDKIERLVEGIKSIVGDSSPKNSELFMRYILNRSLVLQNIIINQLDMSEVGSNDTALRVLISSVNLAIKYYDIDMDVLEKKTSAPYVVFGFDYFHFLRELNKSVFDASAEFAIGRVSLEWLAWDLYRDLSNQKYASEIIKLNNALKNLPSSKISDKQSLAYVRQMKKTSLNVEQLQNDRLGNIQTAERAKNAETEMATREREKSEYLKKFHVSNKIVVRKVGNEYFHLKIAAIYEDGNALLQYPSGSTYGTYPLSELSYLKESSGRFKVNDDVVRTVGTEHYHLKIGAIYEDGYALLLYNSGSTYGTYPLKELSFLKDSFGRFKVDSKVVKKDGTQYIELKIGAIYEDGYALLRYPSGSTYGDSLISDLILRVE